MVILNVLLVEKTNRNKTAAALQFVAREHKTSSQGLNEEGSGFLDLISRIDL
jgi:hypothetical protein